MLLWLAVVLFSLLTCCYTMQGWGMLSGAFEVGLGTQGHVATEAVAVEGDFEAVVVAFATDEGDDVVGATIAGDVEEEGGSVEGDRYGVGGDGADECGGSGVGVPVDGVYGDAVALAEHGDGTVGVADGVVADGDAKVDTIVSRMEIGGLGEVFIRNFPSYDVGRYHAAEGGRVHLF